MFDTILHTLTAAVVTNGTFDVSYPENRSAGSYTNAHNHKMYALQTEYTAPEDFSLSFGASAITVTYIGTTTLPALSRVRLQVDIVGDDKKAPEKVVLPANAHRVPAIRIDLGAADTADADGVAASQSVAEGASFSLNGALVSGGKAVFDVPRNVVAGWTGTAVLTITGKDAAGNTVVEKSASGTSHIGAKAFKEVTSVSSSASITSATVGTGTKLGLPFAVLNAQNVIAEFKNGTRLGRPADRIYIQDRMLEAAVDAGTSLELVSPVAGRIVKLTTVAGGTITTGGAITVEVDTVAVDGLSVTVADGAVAGEVDSDVPTADHATAVVAVGSRIEIIPAAAFNASADIFCILEIEPTAAGKINGTLTAAVTSKATATTGDTRGTYVPPDAPDGSAAWSLLVLAADPSDAGVDQYAG